MRLKSLLFGSAAALMAVTGAQAAEPLEPIAEPVDYVRICDAFGTGFFYIPGTDTCLKIGGYVRADFVYDHDWQDIVVFQADDIPVIDPGNPAVGRRFTLVSPREDRNYNEFGTRARANINFDSRVQTDIGMIRTYTELWITQGPLNGRAFNDVDASLTLRQAFVQIANDWGTVTAGRAPSFFEFWESDSWSTRGLGEDAPLSPLNLAAVTFSLGGGVSASISLEDTATDSDRRLGDTGPTFFPVDLNEDGIPDALGLAGGGFPGGNPFPTGAAITGGAGLHGGNRAPDVVANFRVDQAWGSAQIMGAISPVRARAFTGPGPVFALGLTPDQEPDTEIGWAVGAGAGIDIPGTGITFNIQGVYSEGAPDYATDRSQVGALSDGFVVGLFDANLASPTFGTLLGTEIDLVEAWSVKAGIGGDLAPDWVFNLQGSFARVDNPEALGAPSAVPVAFPGSGAPGAGPFFAPGPTAVQPQVFTGGGATGGLVPGPIFSGDFDHWTASGLIAWAPVAGFITGLELAYEKVEFDAGPDTDRWGGVWRVQKSF